MTSRSLLQRFTATVAGRTPAAPAGRRSPRALVAERTLRGVLELAVRIGEVMLSLGAAASDVTDVIRRVGRAYGVECQVDLTFTSILVAYEGGADAPGMSVLRVVENRVGDYGRLTRVVDLARELVENPHELSLAAAVDDPAAGDAVQEQLERAHARLDAIVLAPQRYRRAFVTLLLAAMSAGVAVLLGGGPLVIVLAAATTAVIDVVVHLLGRWGLPAFFQQVAGAATATTVAVLLLAVIPGLPLELTTLPPSLVVASGIVVLLAGLSLVGAADDAINGFPVTASGRLLEVLLLTLGIVVGIGGVLDIARRLGVDLVLVDTAANPWPLPVQTLGAAVVSGAWAMASQAGHRATLAAALTGAGGYVAFSLLSGAGIGAAPASTAAALLIGFAGEAGASRIRVPSLVTTVCAVIPLLPGLAIYRGMLDIVAEDGAGVGSEMLVEAGLIGLGLAAGVTLGEFLARRVGASHRVLLPAAARLRRRRPSLAGVAAEEKEEATTASDGRS